MRAPLPFCLVSFTAVKADIFRIRIAARIAEQTTNRPCSRWWAVAGMAVVLLLSVQPPVLATPIFSAIGEASVNFNTNRFSVPSATLPFIGRTASNSEICGFDSHGQPNCFASSFVSVSGNTGSIGTFANAGVNNFVNIPVSVSTNGIAEGRLEVDDVLFLGPSQSVAAAINLSTTGVLGVTRQGTATFFARIEVTDSSGRVLFDLIGERRANQDGSFTGSGIYAAGIPSITTSDPFDVVVGVPVTLTMLARSTTSSGGAAGLLAEAISNFSATLSLPLTGPVFNLPDGFTVNSPSLRIVDNRWLGPLTVPEPTTLALFGLALAGLFARRQLN